MSYNSGSNTGKKVSLDIPDGYSIFTAIAYTNYGWGFAYLDNVNHVDKSITVGVKNFGNGSGTVTPTYEVILINQNL